MVFSMRGAGGVGPEPARYWESRMHPTPPQCCKSRSDDAFGLKVEAVVGKKTMKVSGG